MDEPVKRESGIIDDTEAIKEVCKVGEEIEKSLQQAEFEAACKRQSGAVRPVPAISDNARAMQDRSLLPWDMQTR